MLEVAPKLAEGPLAGLRIGVLHGKLPSDEKDTVMRAFDAGEIDVLVATTVIEVGVDVPNSTAMVILDADRFGLSQLHQLRGRVGRGSAPGVCLLVTDMPAGTTARERLDAVASTTDGFELARMDLELRREGDVLGSLQSGSRSGLRLLSLLRHEEIIAKARGYATEIVEGDPACRTRTPGRDGGRRGAGVDRAAARPDVVSHPAELAHPAQQVRQSPRPYYPCDGTVGAPRRRRAGRPAERLRRQLPSARHVQRRLCGARHVDHARTVQAGQLAAGAGVRGQALGVVVRVAGRGQQLDHPLDGAALLRCQVRQPDALGGVAGRAPPPLGTFDRRDERGGVRLGRESVGLERLRLGERLDEPAGARHRDVGQGRQPQHRHRVALVRGVLAAQRGEAVLGAGPDGVGPRWHGPGRGGGWCGSGAKPAAPSRIRLRRRR